VLLGCLLCYEWLLPLESRAYKQGVCVLFLIYSQSTPQRKARPPDQEMMSTIAKTRKPTTRHREEDDDEGERFSKSRMGPLVRRKRKKDQRKGTAKVYEDTDEDETSSSEAYPSPSSSSHEGDSDSDDDSSSGEEEIVAARNKAGKPSLKKKVAPVKAPAKASRSTNEVAPREKGASNDRNKKAKRFHHKVNEEEEEEEIHSDRKGNVKSVQRDRKMARKAIAPSHHLKEVELDDDDRNDPTATIIREKKPRGRPRKSSSVKGSAAASPSLEKSTKKTRRGVIKGGIRKKRRTLVRTRRAASMGLPHGQVMFFVNGKKAPLFMRIKKNQTTTMTGGKEGMEISNNNNELDEDFSRLVLAEASSAGSGRLNNNRNRIQKHQQHKGDGSVEVKGEWGEGEEEEGAVNASRGNVKSASAVINSVKRGKKRDHVKTCLPFGPYTRMIKAILSEFNSSSTVLDDTIYPNDPATPLPQMRITKKAIKLMQAIDEADFVEDLSNSERILRCLDKSTLTPRIIKVAVVTSCKGNNFNQFNLPSTNFIPALPPRPKKTQQQQHRIRPSSDGGLPSQSEEQMAF